ncbi:MAG: NAD(P)H-dependent oxidoreductase [Segetibacter sp.]|jgi:NAD(P)H-dependent FMN reductase|nr:NAD(P)H-dependent oxidoreductase [Segetibacter sp.]
MNIEIVSGSPRQESVTFRLAVFLQNLLQQKTTHQINILDVREWNFPTLQEQVYSSIDNTPDPYKPLARRMFGANAFIIVTPEYNGSYTPPMKNLFDHFPKQFHKAFGIVTASTGAMGGMRASQQLQLLIGALFGIPSPYMLITPQVDKKFDANGHLVDESFSNSIHTFITEFLWLAERIIP